MKVLVVKDGTIPVGVFRLLYEDGFSDPENIDARFGGELELFEVAGEPEALVIAWHEDDGFSVDGESFVEGLKYLQSPETSGEVEPIAEVSPGHLVTTVNPGDREWYIHLFDMRVRFE